MDNNTELDMHMVSKALSYSIQWGLFIGLLTGFIFFELGYPLNFIIAVSFFLGSFLVIQRSAMRYFREKEFKRKGE